MGPSSTKPPNLDPPLPYTSESAPDDGTPSERARKCARALHWIVIFVILSVNVIGPSLEGFCSLPTSCRYGGFEITFEPDWSLDYLVGQDKQVSGNIEPDRAGGLEVDHELKFGWLLDRHLGRISTSENAVDEIGSTTPQSDKIRRI